MALPSIMSREMSLCHTLTYSAKIYILHIDVHTHHVGHYLSLLLLRKPLRFTHSSHVQLGMLLSYYFFFVLFFPVPHSCCVYFWHKFPFRFLWRVFMTATRKTVEHPSKKKKKIYIWKKLLKKSRQKNEKIPFESARAHSLKQHFPSLPLVWVLCGFSVLVLEHFPGDNALPASKRLQGS